MFFACQSYGSHVFVFFSTYFEQQAALLQMDFHRTHDKCDAGQEEVFGKKHLRTFLGFF